MDMLLEIPNISPYPGHLAPGLALQALVACAMLRGGYSILQVAGLLVGFRVGNLPEFLQRILSDGATESWLRTNLIRHEAGILEEAKSSIGPPADQARTTNDVLLDQFNSIAMTLSGKQVGESPDAEIELLETIDLNFEKICTLLSAPLSPERVQASVWLRDLASFPRILPTMSRRSQLIRLTRLRLKLALPPRRLGSALLSIPLFMDLQPNH